MIYHMELISLKFLKSMNCLVFDSSYGINCMNLKNYSMGDLEKFYANDQVLLILVNQLKNLGRFAKKLSLFVEF